MKNYTLFSLIFFTFFSSCKYVEIAKMSDNQNIEIQNSIRDTFILHEDRIYVNSYINNIKKSLILDTGAPSCVYNYNGKINKEVSVGELETPNGEKIANNLIVIDSFNTKSIFIQNPVFRRLLHETDKCKIKSDGILGVEFLCYGKLSLNFDNNTIEYLDDKSFDVLVKNYKEIKDVAYDDLNYNFIFPVVINKKSIKLKFDTGYNGSIFLTDNDYNLNSKRPNERVKIGLVTKTVAKANNDTLKFYNSNINILNDEINNVQVATALKIRRNLAGTAFIKRFNWVLDYENHKMYYKVTDINNFENKNDKLYKSKIIANKIIITAKDITATQYKLGSQIVSINNQKVTESNICVMHNLLDNTSDWNKLKLDTELSPR